MQVRLDRWAELNFDPPPCRKTLRQWAEEGMILPSPVRIGKFYYVEQGAKHVATMRQTRRLA